MATNAGEGGESEKAPEAGSNLLAHPELTLCGNVVKAACILLNKTEITEEALLEKWTQIKHQILRDVLALWCAGAHPNSELAISIQDIGAEGSNFTEAYDQMARTCHEHFGQSDAPRLFQVEANPHLETTSIDYWNQLTHGKGEPFPFASCDLSLVSSVYDEFLDYKPMVLASPRAWKMKQKLPVLAKVDDEKTADYIPGQIGLLRLHSRDDAVSERDKKGAFYTPYPVALDIANRTLSPLLVDKRPEEILSIRVCDPALGSGVFLLAAMQVLSTHHHSMVAHQVVQSVDNPKLASKKGVVNRRFSRRRRHSRFSRRTRYRRHSRYSRYPRYGRRSRLRHNLMRRRETSCAFDQRVEEEEQPSLLASKHAVLSHCLFGVDLDETALDVAEAVLVCDYQDGNQPSVDLSHRLRCGNSLLGLPSSEMFVVPDVAFENARMKKAAEQSNDKANHRTHKSRDDERKRIKKQMKRLTESTKTEMLDTKQQTSLMAFENTQSAPDNALASLKQRLEELKKERLDELRQPSPLTRSFHTVMMNHATKLPLFSSLADAVLATWWKEQRSLSVELVTEMLPNYIKFLSEEYEGDNDALSDFIEQLPDVAYPEHFHTTREEATLLREELKLFHWELEFPELFLGPNAPGGFDAMLGNPPWGIELSPVELRRFDWAFPHSGDKETAWAFLELSMRLVRPEKGRIGFIIPNTFLLNNSSKSMRSEVVHHWSIEQILDYSDVSLFEGAHVRAVQLHLKNQPPVEDHTYHFQRPERSPPTTEFTELFQRDLAGRSHWACPERNLVIDRLKFTTIGETCTLRQGYKPYVKDKFIDRGLDELEVEKIMHEQRFHYDQEREGLTLQRWGGDIKPFKIQHLEGKKRWVDLSLTAEGVPEEWQTGPRLAVREIAGDSPNLIIAAYTDDLYVHDPSIISLKMNEGYEWMYPIVELYLNSTISEEHVTFFSSKVRKGVFAKFTLGDLKHLPVPRKESLTDEQLDDAKKILKNMPKKKSEWQKWMKTVDDFTSCIYDSSEPEQLSVS